MIENFFQPIAKNVHKASPSTNIIGNSMIAADKISEDSLVIFSVGHDFPEVRKAFSRLAKHFENTQIADLGLFNSSKSEKNNIAGLREVLLYLYAKQSKVLILSTNATVVLAQWQVEKELQNSTDCALITPSFNAPIADYLFDVWKQKQDRQHLFHFSLIASQSYYNDLSTYDELNNFFYDDMRLGEFRANPHNVETLLREADFAGFDMNALKRSDFTAQTSPNPNGLYSEEACLIARYAGVSNKIKSMSMLELNSKKMSDTDAQLIAQMMWYFTDGVENRYHDFPNPESRDFKVIHCPLEGSPLPEVVFIKSLISGRMWMQVPFGKQLRWTGCTEDDYNIAVQGEVPEKWFRAVGF
ncbi:MAG: hypothetical protein LC109_11075 [Bacteroidia bacterium]|nr:hypothetical protein [Bacteroidia bacterium]